MIYAVVTVCALAMPDRCRTVELPMPPWFRIEFCARAAVSLQAHLALNGMHLVAYECKEGEPA
jgi:hypothetical protein